MSYLQFEKFFINNYSSKVKVMAREFLVMKEQSCEERIVSIHIMNELRKEAAFKSGIYANQTVENRIMLNSIFKVLLTLEVSDGISLCWSILSLI